MTIHVIWAMLWPLWLLTCHPHSLFPPREQLLTAVVGGGMTVVVWIEFRSVMSESTRSYDHSPDWKFGTRIPMHTHNTVETDTVLHGFGKLKPIPMHTHDTLSWVYPYLCHAVVLRDYTWHRTQITFIIHGASCIV